MSKQPWRVIENPDDGTSQWRARVVHGSGLATIVRAMFVDADVAKDYAAVLNVIDGESVFAQLAAARADAEALRVHAAIHLGCLHCQRQAALVVMAHEFLQTGEATDA